MVQPVVTVDGVRELRRALRDVKDKELDDELKAIHKSIADDIIAIALPRVPVLTGRLRASVRAAGNKSGAVGRAGRKSVPYAAVIHWGWPKRKIRENRFLYDAAKSVEQDITERYAREVSEMFDRVIRNRRTL